MQRAETQFRVVQCLASFIRCQVQPTLPLRFGVVIHLHRLDGTQLLLKVQLHGHVTTAEMLIDRVFVEFGARTDWVDLADHLAVADDLHVIVGHAAQVDAAGWIVGQRVAPATFVRLERAVLFKNVEREAVGARIKERFLIAQRMFVRGAWQVLQHDVRVVGMQPRLFDRRSGNKFGVVHQVLIHRRVLRHVENQRAVAFAPDAPGLLPETGQRARMTGEDADIEISDVDAQFKRVGRDDHGDAPLEKILLKLTPLSRQQSPAIRFDPLFQLGVTVGNCAPETLHPLPRAAEADGADAGGRSGADQRDRNRSRPLAETRGTGTLHQRRINQVKIAARPRRTVAVDHCKRTVEERLDMLARIAHRRGAADKARRRAVHGANAQQTAENIGDVRPKRATIGMHLIYDNILEASQQITPAAMVIGQDSRMQHVGIGDHKVRPLHDLAALLARGVAIKGAEFAGAERSFKQCAERTFLIA